MKYAKLFAFICLRLALHAVFVVVVLYPASYVALVHGVSAVQGSPGASSAGMPVVLFGYAALLLGEAGVIGYRAPHSRWVRAGQEYVALVAGTVGGLVVLLTVLTHYAYGFPMFYLGAAFWLALFLGVEFALAAIVRGAFWVAMRAFPLGR